MRKVLLALALGFCSVGYAQLLEVASIEKMDVPVEAGVGNSVISPNGDFLLMTTPNKKGLKKYDLATGQVETITEAAGAGYDVKILDDGQTIVYRETAINSKKLKETTLKSKNMVSGAESTLVNATRNLQAVVVDGNSVYAIDKGALKTKSFSGATVSTDKPVLSIDNGQLMITKNGKTATFSPNGTEYTRYIWPSISPDGTKALYYVVGSGAYICNLDKSEVTRLGVLRAPKWYSDDIVVGMYDIDGEDDTEKSSIMAVAADASVAQTLTDDSVIAMYPSVSEDGSKIVFTTVGGEVYIINIK
ncbi:MAG: hypothetical protein R3Y22_08695 [Bacteroidales bacterium]